MTTHVSSTEGKACSGFNYFLLAQALIAVPAIPLIGAFAASLSQDPAWQITNAAYAGALTLWVVAKLEGAACLSKKIKG